MWDGYVCICTCTIRVDNVSIHIKSPFLATVGLVVGKIIIRVFGGPRQWVRFMMSWRARFGLPLAVG